MIGAAGSPAKLGGQQFTPEPSLGLNPAPPSGRVYPNPLLGKREHRLSRGLLKGIDRLTSRVPLRVFRFRGGQPQPCRPDNPKGQTRLLWVRQLPTYGRPLPISRAGQSSRSAKSLLWSVVSG